MRPEILATGMVIAVVIRDGAISDGVMLLVSLAAPVLDPMPVVNVDAMEVDGASVLAAPLPQVSPRPHLVVKVSHPLRPGDWRLSMDRHSVAVAARATASVLRVALPGPLPFGSRHTV